MQARNSRVGVNVRYLGAVGWQPTALIGNNAGYEQQGWGQREVSWGCRLATYSIYWQQCRPWTAGLGVNVKYLGAVGWQPTASIGNNAGHEQQDLGSTGSILGLYVGNLQHLLATMQAMNSRTWGQREVSWGCRLATYSTYRQQCGLWTAGLGVNVKYLGAVGWQPTALIGNNAGYEQQDLGSTWSILGL